MKRLIVLTIFAMSIVGLQAQTHPEETKPDKTEFEEAGVRKALQLYIDGSSYNDTDRIKAPFYEDALMFLWHPEEPLFIKTPAEYAGFFEKREPGKFNGRVGKILKIDVAHDIAMAQVEILIPSDNMRFMDMFLLKKLDGDWKILSKSATLLPENEE